MRCAFFETPGSHHGGLSRQGFDHEGEEAVLYLDSADVASISRLYQTGVFAGVTTNPKILSESGIGTGGIPRLVATLRQLGVGTLFVQVWGRSYEEMLASARSIQQIDQDVIIKVPAVPAGFQLAAELGAEGASVLVTMVYSPAQALLADAVGAWGIAPYFGRMSDLGMDCLDAADRMVKILRSSQTRILAASLRSAGGVTDFATLGIRDFTLGIAVADQLLNNLRSAEALVEFERIRADMENRREAQV